MFSRSLRRVALAGALFFLYFFGLSRTGLLGPDEPRYAAIGHAMELSGDWVTPRLWGVPWFEKPAGLYWMIGGGMRGGLGAESGPRLPVAILSVAFLVFFFWRLRTALDPRAAFFSTLILATSAGWLAFSHIAVTDLPLAATFGAAMLLIMPGPPKRPLAAGICLGAAVLAKGLVPLVLFMPTLWFLRRELKKVLYLSGAALATALPWYAAVTARNDGAFLHEFFWRHHFERFTSASLEHVQPWWFYLPIALAALFPWTPLLFAIRRQTLRDGLFFVAWLAWGLLFFSLSRNKLPGYLLPLLPAEAVLCGWVLARTPAPAVALAFTAALVWMIPMIATALPAALLTGGSHVAIHTSSLALLCGLASAGVIYALGRRAAVNTAAGLIAGSVFAGVMWILWFTFPLLDRAVSARAYASSHPDIQCVQGDNRSWRYGLEYYLGRKIEACTANASAPASRPVN